MQYSTLTILLVDENPGGVQTLQQMLSPVPDMQFKLAHVQELKKGLKWLAKAPIDVVLLDLPAGDDRKLQGVRQIQAVAPEVPVVVLAAFVAFDADMRILQSGAQDVIVKAEMTAPTLIRSIRHALARTAFARSASTPTDTQPTTTPIQSPPAPPAPPAPAATATTANRPTDPAPATEVATSENATGEGPSPDPQLPAKEIDTATSADAAIESSAIAVPSLATDTHQSEATAVAATTPEPIAPVPPVGHPPATPPPAETSVPAEVDPSPAAPTEATLPGGMAGVDSTSGVVNEEASSVIAQQTQEGEASPQTPAQADFQPYAPMPETTTLGFGSALDMIFQEQVPEPGEESSSPEGGDDAPKPTTFVFPTSDPLSERKDDAKEKAQESTAPRVLFNTVEKDYKNLVEMAEQIFAATNAGTEPDSASVIDAIWRTLEQLRKNDELLEESVRQRRDYHSWSQRGANVAVLSIRLGVEVDCDERRCLALGLCGLMHDLGMLTIPKDVLDSPRFNASQLKQLRQHPLESQKMIENFGESFAWVGKIVAQAHERQDGGGYPRGLKGNQIHEVASILGLADTYEAMSHPRPDRKARATYDALKEIVDRRNYQFDRRIIKALISIVSIFPLGSLVQLSNGEVGRVVRVSKNFPTRPSVEIILDPQGREVNYTRFVVLENEPLLTIVDPAIPEDVLRK